MRKIFPVSILIAVFLGTASAVRQTNEQKYIKVPVKRKPTDKDWTLRDTRTIELLEDMKKLNNELYALIDYFDAK